MTVNPYISFPYHTDCDVFCDAADRDGAQLPSPETVQLWLTVSDSEQDDTPLFEKSGTLVDAGKSRFLVQILHSEIDGVLEPSVQYHYNVWIQEAAGKLIRQGHERLLILPSIPPT